MNIKFCGAAQTVTGSCHLINLDNGFKILLDCGLYQGKDEDYLTFNQEWLFDPKEIDVLILSHAHIDHCGRLPKLVKDGFDGDIICTSATRDLASILLADSALIQMKEFRFSDEEDRKEPLYDLQDVRRTINSFIGIGYDRWFKLSDYVEVMLTDAGHILGSASVTIKIKDNKETFIGFSGDIGRYERPILNDPKPMPHLDYLLCESTYGDRLHTSTPEDLETLLNIIQSTCVTKKGNLIIPAFSVGRTQELIYMLDRLVNQGLLDKINVYIDSPLAIKATEVFRMHPECYDESLMNYMLTDPDPFGFESLRTTRSVTESRQISNYDKPCIIISASGMMQAGRIRHHIWNNIDDEKNTLLIVGYCAPHTLGSYLRSKPDSLRMFGSEKLVKAEIQIMDSFSAHADNHELRTFLSSQKGLKNLFLVHGDPKASENLQKDLIRDGFKSVIVPKLGDEMNLT